MFGQIRSAFETARRRNRDRRDYMRLIDADEAMLRDVGLLREDVRRALQGGSRHF